LVKVGVIGAGYLGKFHIEKFLKIPDCELIGVAESIPAVRDVVKKDYAVSVFSDYKDLLGKVDAVSVVVPTTLHYEVAGFFIENGIHTFIEKPATEAIEQCEAIIKKIKAGLKVQIGHIERFNPVYSIITAGMKTPKAITMRRKAPFILRALDVDIVFDLMIHDIDIVLSLFPKQEPEGIRARGIKAVTDKNDYISADFKIGSAVVHLEASKMCDIKERTITLLDEDSVWEGDFAGSFQKGSGIGRENQQGEGGYFI
jgi:predicted dehydrogenase